MPYILKFDKLDSTREFSLEDKFKTFIPENIHTKFCKFVLGVGKYSSDIATKAELGRYPIAINAITHSLKYWLTVNNRCIPNFDKKLVFLSTYDNNGISSFEKHIQSLLSFMGYNHVYENKTIFSINALICSLKFKFKEKYIDYFKYCINTPDSKLRTYRLFKNSYHMENYLLLNVNKQLIHQLARFRISNHGLEIERGNFATKKPTKMVNTLIPILQKDSVNSALILM